MPRKLNRLTALAVKTAKPHPAGAKLYADGGGLYLQVMPSTARSWIFRYTFAGVPKTMGLGPVHTINLSDAREEAAKMRKMVLLGTDPKIQRDTTKHAQILSQQRTFRTCAEEFVKSIEAEHRNLKAHAQWLSSLERYAYPVIGDIPISEIDVHMIKAIMNRDNAWQEKTETMSRVRGRIERILGWAAVLGLRSADNPARFTKFLSEVLPSRNSMRKVVHHPSLPYKELPRFMTMLKSQPQSISNLALEFLILTAARTGEVIGATWTEINTDENLWVIPAARMKSEREHRVPLSQAALDVLEKLRHDGEPGFIFRGTKYGKSISNMALLQVVRGFRERGLVDSYFVPHGFRSSFRVWCAEATTYPREIAEFALSHVNKNDIEAAYQRGTVVEKRRPMMSEWAAHCLALTQAE